MNEKNIRHDIVTENHHQHRRWPIVGAGLVFFALLMATLMIGTKAGYSAGSPTIEENGLQMDPSPAAFLPVLQTPGNSPRALGQATLISETPNCFGDGETCYEIKVDCRPAVTETMNATLKVGTPMTSTPPAGTILFATGWTGSYFWENAINMAIENGWLDLEGVDLETAGGNNRIILDSLLAAGFQTVQIRFEGNWWKAKLDSPEGFGRLSCRSATTARWVYDNLHGQDETLPYCATGHSNGATHLAYDAAQYYTPHLFSAIVFEGGPNWTSVEHSCLHNNPDYSTIYADFNERKTIDWSFGYPNDGSGPCARQEQSFQPQFQEANLIGDGWRYFYFDTMMAFLIGGIDDSNTADNAYLYYNYLTQAGTPLRIMEVVPGAPHFVTSTEAGRQAMEDTLLNECILR